MEQRQNYTAPTIEVFETIIERGFALSMQNGIDGWDKQEF